MLQNSSSRNRLLKILWIPVRTATKRASGGNKATNNTAGRRLGPKLGEGQPVTPGQIIFRQRGTVWYPGENVSIGRDHTIYAKEPGFVRFYRDPFHPKRKFIGVALKPDYRLPTPHFEPRRRRLGYTPISEPEIAEFEEAFFKRKQVQQAKRTDAAFEQRKAKRSSLAETFASKIAALAPELDAAAASDRLLLIYQFMRGGHTFSDAAKTVDSQHLDDLRLNLDLNRVEQSEYENSRSAYETLAAASDAKVMLSSQLQVCAFKTSEQLAQQLSEVHAQLEEATKEPVNPIEGTSAAVREKVLEILNTPELSVHEINQLKSKFLRRPVPVLASSGDFAKLAKAGKGRFMTVWDAKQKKMQEFFVPENAVMVF